VFELKAHAKEDNDEGTTPPNADILNGSVKNVVDI
jgi:hypothetical protein